MNDARVPIEIGQLSEVAKERSAFYAFLNMHFLMTPDERTIQGLRHSELAAAFSAIADDPEINPDLANGWRKFQMYLEKTMEFTASDLAQTLGIDRTRLYRGVSGSFGPPPPYEAVWVNEDRDAEKVLGKLMATYREAGFALDEKYKDRVDYIGAEMDYLCQLASREAEAWETGDTRGAIDIIQKEVQFILSLSAWFSLFKIKAMEFVQTDFYKGHLMMVSGFLADERERLEGLMEEAQDGSASKLL